MRALSFGALGVSLVLLLPFTGTETVTSLRTVLMSAISARTPWRGQTIAVCPPLCGFLSRCLPSASSPAACCGYAPGCGGRPRPRSSTLRDVGTSRTIAPLIDANQSGPDSTAIGLAYRVIEQVQHRLPRPSRMGGVMTYSWDRGHWVVRDTFIAR